MFLNHIDLTTALRPSYLPEEVLLFVQDNVGLYEGYVSLISRACLSGLTASQQIQAAQSAERPGLSDVSQNMLRRQGGAEGKLCGSRSERYRQV